MNRTKRRRLLLGVLCVLLITILIWVNRAGTQTGAALYQSAALEVCRGSQTVILDAETLRRLSTEAFEATFQRKVGPAEERSYSGIPLSGLLAAAGISADGAGSIAIVSLDQYRVELPVEEALRPGNLYLASTQDGAALSKEDGPYLLVIREDALSTRWVRQVVRLEVCG